MAIETSVSHRQGWCCTAKNAVSAVHLESKLLAGLLKPRRHRIRCNGAGLVKQQIRCLCLGVHSLLQFTPVDTGNLSIRSIGPIGDEQLVITIAGVYISEGCRG